MSATEIGAVSHDVPSSTAREETLCDVRVAAGLALVLAVLGALLGLVWTAWSPPRPPALILPSGQFEVLAEDESLVAADGRYLVITAVVGLLAALVVWFLLPRRRGATVMIGLGVGTLVGGALTELVGHLTGGGSFDGKPALLTDGSRQEVTRHLPLSLHMPWLVVLETVIAALIYGLLVAFAAADDLGRPDPVRDAVLLRRRPASVHPDGDAQHAGGYGDAPGALQQSDLPPQ